MEFSVSGWSLTDIIAEVQKQGIKNLSSVRLEMAPEEEIESWHYLDLLTSPDM